MQIKERSYLFLRKLFFWLSFLVFVIFTPIIVYYSLGYKFDPSVKKFVKTGIVFIRTFPKGVDVFIDGKRLKESSPCVIRGLLPKEYQLILEKEGFYPYQLSLPVKPAKVLELDVVLISKTAQLERIKFDFNIYRFFVSRHFLGNKIIAFTDKGIYFLDRDFKNAKLISSVVLGEDLASSVEDFKEGSSRLVFWNKNNIWITDIVEPFSKEEAKVTSIYKSGENIKEVFFGLKDKYLVIQDGLKIITQDIYNPSVHFTVFELKSQNAKIFYDNGSETLYIRDIATAANIFSLFKIELMPLVYERKENKKNP